MLYLRSRVFPHKSFPHVFKLVYIVFWYNIGCNPCPFVWGRKIKNGLGGEFSKFAEGGVVSGVGGSLH